MDDGKNKAESRVDSSIAKKSLQNNLSTARLHKKYV